MYTLHTLQERLDKAKSTLREVESNISRVEGKPHNTTFNARFSKSGTGKDEENGGDRRRFKDESPGDHFNMRRRRVVDESGSWRRPEDGDTGWRTFDKGSDMRRRSAPSPEDPPPRKRLFPSVREDEFESEGAYEKRKSIFSALGKIQKSDDHPQRNRHIRQRDGDFVRTQSRSIFSRLSGPHREEWHDEAMEDEDASILQRQTGPPSMASRVEAIDRPSMSREQVLASEKKDEKSKQRDRRMFGALVGTLQQFRREETQVKEREERRQQIEKKLEDEAIRDRERMAEEKHTLMMERKRRESDIKRIEWSLNRVKEFGEWEAGVLLLKNFIQTKSEPHVFFIPKVHNDKTEKLLEESTKSIEDLIEKRRATLEEEISSSELKARRAAGEVDDVDKENDGGNISVKEEEAESEWVDASFDKDAAADEANITDNITGPPDEKPSCDELAEGASTAAALDTPADPVPTDTFSEIHTQPAHPNEDTNLQLPAKKDLPRSPSPATKPKADSPTKPGSRKVKTRSRSRQRKVSKSRSRSPRSRRNKKASVKRGSVSPRRRSPVKSRSRSRSRDSPKKLGIIERLERLAGQKSSSEHSRASRERKRSPAGAGKARKARGSRSGSSSSSSSSSSRSSSSSNSD